MDATTEKTPWSFAETSDAVPPQLLNSTARVNPPKLEQIQKGVDIGRVVLVRFNGVPLTLIGAILGTLMIHASLVLLWIFGPLLLAKLPEEWGGPGKGEGRTRSTGSANGTYVILGSGGAGAGSKLTGTELPKPPAPEALKPETVLTALPPAQSNDAASVLIQRGPDPLLTMGTEPLLVMPKPVPQPKSNGVGPGAVANAGGNGKGLGTTGTGVGKGRIDMGGAGDGNGDEDGPMLPSTKGEVASGMDRGGSAANKPAQFLDWGRGDNLTITLSDMDKWKNKKVDFDVKILANGTIGDVVIKESSGNEELDRHFMNIVRHARFAPAYKDGRAVESWFKSFGILRP